MIRGRIIALGWATEADFFNAPNPTKISIDHSHLPKDWFKPRDLTVQIDPRALGQ